jgi:aquaporin Z
VNEFDDQAHELRRLVSEAVGTFLLVLVAAGGSMVDTLSHGAIGRGAEVTAPGLMVAAIVLFMGTNSGAHLNPVVTLAFAIRNDFHWRRVSGYIVAQLVGSITAAAILRLTFGGSTSVGVTSPGPGFSPWQAVIIETLLTFGLVSVVLGAASGAQNIGALSAVAARSYIVLAGLWASPVSGASMNLTRSLGPAILSGNYTHLWIYLLGPLLGALLACPLAYLLRGSGGGTVASKAAQGNRRPHKATKHRAHRCAHHHPFHATASQILRWLYGRAGQRQRDQRMWGCSAVSVVVEWAGAGTNANSAARQQRSSTHGTGSCGAGFSARRNDWLEVVVSW